MTLDTIDKPDKELNELSDPLKYGLEHERYVTDLIHTIYKAAHEVHDYRTMKFLDWYVEEQGEEEKNASDLINKFELFGHDAKVLYQLNNELRQRHDAKVLYQLNNELRQRTYTTSSILAGE